LRSSTRSFLSTYDAILDSMNFDVKHVGSVGQRLFAKAAELGLESIIAKKADAP
jgi:hypothetical protein